MKKFKAKFQNILLVLLLISCFGGITDVFAASTAKVEFNGNSSVSVGSNITVNLKVTSVNSDQESYNGVVSLAGYLSFDSTYLEYVSATPATSPYAFSINKNNNYKIAGMDFSGSNGIKSSTVVFTFVFKALKAGTTQVTLTNAKLTDSTFQYTTSVVPKNITIGASNPTTPTTPTTKPTKPTLTTPTKKTTPTTKTPPTTKKTPTDTKSSDATLKKLVASGYKLSPEFNKDITSYVVEVPSSTTTVKLTGEKNDSKASVTGLGNITLTGDETKAEVVVTAENGSTKKYVIKVKRGKDPNKQLSTNNYLASLSVNNGILSPVFNREKNNYVVYLPFEIDSIEIAAIVEDTTYATLKVDGPNSLNVGTNTYTFTVTAEDESVRVYTVNVIRGRSLDSDSTNTYLKEINLKNGKLKGKFDKNTYLYYYSKTKGFSVNAIAEDENSEVAIKYVEDVVIITVSDSTNDFSVYVLLPKENNSYKYIIVGIIAFVVGSITGIGISKFIKKRKTLK